MIRVLHVVSSLNINSGMMSVIMNYYRHINKNEIQFDFLFFEKMKDTHQAEIEMLGGKTYYLSYPTFSPLDQFKLRRFFENQKGKYIAVHCHPIWASEVVAREAKRSGIRHIIQHAHSTRFSEKKISEIRNRILTSFIGFFATDFIACNNDAALLFGSKRTRSGEVFILPNAIDLEKYTFDENLRSVIRTEFNVNNTTLVLGSVGRLSKEKNQCYLIDIFKSIIQEHPDSKLILVGDGILREQIEDKIKQLNLCDKVILTGKRRDIKAILSGLDVFLLPSVFEGTPISAIEARTSGLPCLLSDRITKSVEMPGIKFMSINVNPKKWAKEAVNFAEEWTQNRNDYSEVVKHGFSIYLEVKRLEDYYLRLR